MIKLKFVPNAIMCEEKYAIKDPNDKVRGPKRQILHSRVHAQIA